jgi:hypothetical protein
MTSSCHDRGEREDDMVVEDAVPRGDPELAPLEGAEQPDPPAGHRPAERGRGDDEGHVNVRTP